VVRTVLAYTCRYRAIIRRGWVQGNGKGKGLELTKEDTLYRREQEMVGKRIRVNIGISNNDQIGRQETMAKYRV